MPDGLIILLLALILVALVVIAVVLLRRSRGPAEAKPAAPAQDPFGSADVDAVRGDPRQLAPGAIVEIRGETYAVRGSMRMTEGSWSWDEHLLETADGGKAWLSVEEDPDLELILYTELPDATPDAGETVELDGQRYELDEAGSAQFAAEGTTGLDQGGTVRYRDYTGPGGKRLSLEDFGTGSWSVSRGEVLSRYEVRVYPAAG